MSPSGNAYLLTAPAEIVAATQIALGNEYMLEVIDGDLV